MAVQIIERHLDVYLSITGWTVVHRAKANWDGDGEYWDNMNTGIGKYKTRAEAIVEAKSWSESDGIPLAKGLE